MSGLQTRCAQVSPGAHIDPLSSQPTVRTDVSVDAMRGPKAWVPHSEFEKKGISNPLKGRKEIFFLLTTISKNLCLVWRSREIFLAEDAERAEVERDERGWKWRPSDSRGTRTRTGRQTGMWGLILTHATKFSEYKITLRLALVFLFKSLLRNCGS